MSYLDLGFDQFLSRIPENTNGAISSLQQDAITPDLSGSKVQGGIMQSNDSQTQLNLEQGYFSVKEGSTDLVRLGRQEDGTVGLLVKDRSGNILINFTGGSNTITSPDGKMELNFDDTQFLVRDEYDVVKVLIGKDEGGF